MPTHTASRLPPMLRMLPRLLLLAALICPAQLLAASDTGETTPEPAPKSVYKGMLDFNGYYDTREFSVMTLNVLVNLPGNVQYFSLTNYANTLGAEKLTDFSHYYSEQNLRWAPFSNVPLDLATQWVHRSGENNDMLRVGLRWRLMHTPFLQSLFEKIGLMYFINFHALQIDFQDAAGQGMQIEHVYRLNILPELLDKRVYLAGFLDHNLWLGGDAGSQVSTLVTEHQLGVRVIDHLHLVVELRRNEFFAEKQNGIGLGLQYIVPFTLAD